MTEPKTSQRRRFKFTPEEDKELRKLVEQYGENAWVQVSAKMSGRNPRQCRERWKHYLSAQKTSHDPFTEEENKIIMDKYIELGPKWTKIAKFLVGRSDIQIKERVMKNIRAYKLSLSLQQNRILPQQLFGQKEPEKVQLNNDGIQKLNENSIKKNENTNEISDSLKNFQNYYIDIPIDILNQTTTNDIEYSNNAENLFPYEF